MIKSNKEVTHKTREACETQETSKTENCEKCLSEFFSKFLLKVFSSLGKSHSAEKKRKVANDRRINKLDVAFKIG